MRFTEGRSDGAGAGSRRRLTRVTVVVTLAVSIFLSGAMVWAADQSGAAVKRWTRLQSSMLARAEVASVRIGHFIYVVGGFPEGFQTISTVERYNIRSDQWRPMPPMPVALNHPAAVGYKGRLYVHGGFPGIAEIFSFGSTSGLYRFNPERNRWTQQPSSPTPRAAEAAAVIGHRMYVAGGANQTGSVNSLEIYDFHRKRWQPGPSFQGPARNHALGVASDGYFYVLGGRSGGTMGDPSLAQNYPDVDRYNPRRHRWLRRPPMLEARSGFGAATLGDDRIVAFGGEDWPFKSVIGTAELFDPGTGRWTFLPDMPTPRHGLGAAALGDRVYAIEGATDVTASEPTSLLEALDVPAASNAKVRRAKVD
jgi:N-acetylneuraminic acid mutarotase